MSPATTGPRVAHFLEHAGRVVGVRVHELRQRAPATLVRAEMMADERPVLDRQDGRLVRPLLRELAVAVDERVEARAVVRTQPRERHLIVRWKQHVHGVDLQKPDLSDQAPQMRCR